MALIVTPEDRKLAPHSEASDVLMQYLRDDAPYAHVSEVPPGHVSEPHSHSETEVTVILRGTAQVGDRVCGAGSVLVIEADEEYGLIAGDDEPLTFLVVRPKRASYKLS